MIKQIEYVSLASSARCLVITFDCYFVVILHIVVQRNIILNVLLWQKSTIPAVFPAQMPRGETRWSARSLLDPNKNNCNYFASLNLMIRNKHPVNPAINGFILTREPRVAGHDANRILPLCAIGCRLECALTTQTSGFLSFDRNLMVLVGWFVFYFIFPFQPGYIYVLFMTWRRFQLPDMSLLVMWSFWGSPFGLGVQAPLLFFIGCV